MQLLPHVAEHVSVLQVLEQSEAHDAVLHVPVQVEVQLLVHDDDVQLLPQVIKHASELQALVQLDAHDAVLHDPLQVEEEQLVV